jgi:hypothetical protein
LEIHRGRRAEPVGGGERVAEFARVEVAQADVAYLARPHQFVEGADGLLDRGRLIRTVRQVQVDPVGTQAPQARVDLLADVPGRQAAVLRPRPDRTAHLGRHDDPVPDAPAAHPPAEPGLRAAAAVGVGRVEQRDPGGERAVENGERGPLVVAPAEEFGRRTDSTEVPAAQCEHRHLKLGSTEPPVTHAPEPSPSLAPPSVAQRPRAAGCRYRVRCRHSRG